MANEQELNEKNEYFEYVESRIENLEKLILQKDDELKSLILKTSQREPVQLEKDRNEDNKAQVLYDFAQRSNV